MAYTFVGTRFGSFKPDNSEQEIFYKKAAFITDNKDGSHWVKEVKLTEDCLQKLNDCPYGAAIDQLMFDEYGRLTDIK